MKQYKLIPDWKEPKGIFMVYPGSLLGHKKDEDRAHLVPFYAEFILFLEMYLPDLEVTMLFQERDSWILNQYCADHPNVLPITIKCEDIWIRDWGPIPVLKKNKLTAIKLTYNPSYHYGLVPAIDDRAGRIIQSKYFNTLINEDINFDGGNLINNGNNKAIMLDSIFRDNLEHTKKELVYELRKLFQLEELIVLPTLIEDEIGHSDGVVRFLNENTVLVASYEENDNGRILYRYGEELASKLNDSFDIIQIPCYAEDFYLGQSKIGTASGCYCNYLRVHNVIILPQFGEIMDEVVISKLQSVVGKEIEILPFPYPKLTKLLANYGGVFNCITNLYY